VSDIGGGINDSRITTPFGAQSTAAEVVAGIDITGRRAVVTGGASGIGVETARALAVLHYDADFELIAGVTGQPQAWIVPRGTAD
jgi:hypothetical protein